MGMMQRFRDGLARFMYGRNGMDQLNQALFRLYIGVFIVQLVLNLVRLRRLAAVCDGLLWVVMIFTLFRMFSRNLPRRQLENQKWLTWWWDVRSRSAGARARHADKEHKYFTCKACGAVCRVPAGKGKIVITCPRCGGKIQGKS